MLAKENRFTSKELQDVGRFSLVRTFYFDIKKPEKYNEKYACIMSAKQFKGAVVRNKIKRTLYRILQSELSKKEKENPLPSALIYPKKTILTVDTETIKKELLSHL